MKVNIVGGNGSRGAALLSEVIRAQHGATVRRVRLDSRQHNVHSGQNVNALYMRWRSAGPHGVDTVMAAAAEADRNAINWATESAVDKLRFFSIAHKFDHDAEGSPITPINAPRFVALSVAQRQRGLYGESSAVEFVERLQRSRLVFRQTTRGSGGGGIHVVRRDELRGGMGHYESEEQCRAAMLRYLADQGIPG